MNLIEIFKAGTRPDANGIEITITPAELQQAVENYNAAYHEAPAVIGHPEHNHPAYAWVKRLQLDGDTLKAEFDQIDPDFAEMVEKGRFKKISASFYLANSPNNPRQGALYLRHVGFLGAMPPAVKGLKNPIFNESLNGVVDGIIEGIVAFEEPFSIASDEAQQLTAQQPATQQPAPQQGENPMDKDQQIAELTAKLAEAEQAKTAAELAKTEAEQAKAQAESEANQLKADKAEAELAQATADNAAFCEALVSSGKLTPATKTAALNLLNGITQQAAGKADFGEGEMNQGESLFALTKTLLNSLPQAVHFGEFATQAQAAEPEKENISYAEGTDPVSIEADQKIRAYAKAHGLTYAEAFSALFH